MSTNLEIASFLRNCSSSSQFISLFDHMADISFFVKDRQFRLVTANRSFWNRFGFASAAELVGKNDFELFPPRLAQHFRRDDEEILRTGRPKLQIVELFFNQRGLPDWFCTNKLPLFNFDKEVIGIIGTVRRYMETNVLEDAVGGLGAMLSYLRKNFRKRITIADLIKISGMSPRQLNRKFRQVFHTTPHRFLINTRVEAACDSLLVSNKSIVEVALECGFFDQSSFTQHFRAHTGLTPLRYRKSHLTES